MVRIGGGNATGGGYKFGQRFLITAAPASAGRYRRLLASLPDTTHHLAPLAADAPTILCRRCGRAYRLPVGAILPACPHCGASPRGLVSRLRDNRLSATLATLGAVTLGVSLTLPFMTMTTLGEQRQFSLVGGVAQLYRDGHAVIATVLLVFSVIFPFAKLAALLLATSSLAPVPMGTRRLLHKAADVTGKYSLLDVVVIAMLIVLIKFRGVAHVSAESGVVWFCAGVLLSIAAGLTVSLPVPEGSPSPAPAPDARP